MTMRPSENQNERDTSMTGTYVAVIAVEALIIAALWALGRMYA
jgi:hypothetical protein